MKTLISITAAAFALGTAGAALAQDPQVEVAGTAEAQCTLPGSWSVESTFNGATGFGGSTWNIPSSALATADGMAVSGGEYALRVRGVGFCNASHTIQLQSSRGGLVVGDPSTSPPAGFANRRNMKYEAHWSGGGGPGTRTPFGPATGFTPTTPGQLSNAANYQVSGALAPPGNRTFDVRMGLQRGALATPLIAGDYSDTVTVTIALAP